MPPQHAADHVHGVATVGKEAPLLRTFTGVSGGMAELPPPDLPQLLSPIDVSITQGLIDISTGQAALGQFFANSLGPIAAPSAAGYEAFKVTRLREQALIRQAVEGTVDHLGRSAALTQLACEFNPPMLALRQQVHRRPSHSGVAVEHDGHVGSEVYVCQIIGIGSRRSSLAGGVGSDQ